MAIPDHHRANFMTLRRAAEEGRLALIECTEKTSGLLRYALCAVYCDESGEYVFTPFGHLHEGNAFEAYQPPEPAS